MNPATRHRIFSALPIWLWPYVWLQLWGLQRWIRASGRGLLIAVCPRSGHVYITRVADAPAPEGAYTWTPPRQFAWARLAVAEAPRLCAACPGIFRAHFVDRPRPALTLAPPFADTS